MGLQGPTGPQGLAGPQGPDGFQGPTNQATGATGVIGPQRTGVIGPTALFISSGLEALAGTNQNIVNDGLITFVTIQNEGTGITFNGTNTFTLNAPGLYHVEWNVNLAANSAASAFGLLQNGVPGVSTMGHASTSGGNMGGGAIIRVLSGAPIPIALQNRSGATRTIVINTGASASIRIARFADGPAA
ncbi:hypothetical protein J2Z48_001670 [Croceifilum oryzae]|uniref:BclA C-terminal domain-containing protein n=1 Tax=Croceifilum oryzae TaxID=1553429 RepID=A0AAJ1TJ61_9BACL|nr:hypothetical protein [Croceifilum oryzae]MDQ0417497.1 hypothetical protein [Croceifilum oryzae]